MNIRLVKRPSPDFWAILESRRVKTPYLEEISVLPDAVGLIQGPVALILEAADLAEKAAAVKVAEIHGVCPSHMSLIAIYGDTSAVAASLEAIREELCKTNPG